MIATLKGNGIRRFTPEDYDQGGIIALEYYQEHAEKFGIMLSASGVRRMLDWFSGKMPGAFAFVAEQDGIIVGFICGMVVPWMFDPAITVFEEIAWFMSRRNRRGSMGVRLYKAAMDHAKSRGARFAFMSAEVSGKENVGQFYNRNGFKELERKWMKRL